MAVDVIALAKITTLDYYLGDYRTLATIPAGDPVPETQASGFRWIKIAQDVTLDDAYAIMNMYQHATRAKA